MESNPDSLVGRIDEMLEELQLLKQLVVQRRLITVDPNRCPSPPFLYEGEALEHYNGRAGEWDRWKDWLYAQKPQEK